MLRVRFGTAEAFVRSRVQLLADLLHAAILTDLGDSLRPAMLHELAQLLQADAILGRTTVNCRHLCCTCRLPVLLQFDAGDTFAS